ncbi:MAG: ATP-binding protein [Bacteroidota bacterium]|nr:ATP-binding protein [Bacteroidota bacterium]
MTFEPILLFFLIRHLRKTARTFLPDPSWDKIFTWAMYAVGILFILDLFFINNTVAALIWDFLILGVLYITWQRPLFAHVSAVVTAILPLIILATVSDILEVFFHPAYKKVEAIIGFAFVAATTLMIALLIKSNKQIKALEAARKRSLEEEEKRKFIAGQNEKLEIIVAERTEEITRQKDELQHALTELKATQAQLIHSEKMASLGELTAGIAHEIQNPLNFVNNFAEVNYELIEELKNELSTGNPGEATSIAENIKENEQKIIHHGKRADAIVKGMLQHSRSSNGQKEPTDINALADEYLRLSYHGLRAKDKSFNSKMETCFDESLEKISVVPQDVGRAFLNLFTNAFYAVSERKKMEMDGYMPTVVVSTKKLPGKVQVKVWDNGLGIPEKALDKIFQPFFTTKPSGQGTGLGLSLSFEIITQGHGGEMKVDTKEGEFAEFVIELPAQNILN